jgi:hypothetical protein
MVMEKAAEQEMPIDGSTESTAREGKGGNKQHHDQFHYLISISSYGRIVFS